MVQVLQDDTVISAPPGAAFPCRLPAETAQGRFPLSLEHASQEPLLEPLYGHVPLMLAVCYEREDAIDKSHGIPLYSWRTQGAQLS